MIRIFKTEDGTIHEKKEMPAWKLDRPYEPYRL